VGWGPAVGVGMGMGVGVGGWVAEMTEVVEYFRRLLFDDLMTISVWGIFPCVGFISGVGPGGPSSVRAFCLLCSLSRPLLPHQTLTKVRLHTFCLLTNIVVEERERKKSLFGAKQRVEELNKCFIDFPDFKQS